MSAQRPVRAGFVVSKAVGGSVVRSRVKRRLRHLVAARLDRLPAPADLVVRANPAAAGGVVRTAGRGPRPLSGPAAAPGHRARSA